MTIPGPFPTIPYHNTVRLADSNDCPVLNKLTLYLSV